MVEISISKFQFDREFEGHGFVSRSLLCATLVKQVNLFIYLFNLLNYHSCLSNLVPRVLSFPFPYSPQAVRRETLGTRLLLVLIP